MDRTANDLLQQISNLTSQSVNPITPAVNSTGKPVDDALIESLLEAAAQIEPNEVESLVEEFSSEFSPDELLSAAQALLGEEELMGESGNQALVDSDQATDQVAKFAKDPYVAETDDEVKAFTAVPKSVEEILQSISGYQPEDETDHSPDTGTKLEPSADSSIHDILPGDEVSLEPTTIEQSGVAGKANDSTEKAQPVDAVSEPSSSGEETVETSDELSQPDFYVNAFADAADIVEGTPAPIRGAFEVDHELFDYQVVEEPDVYADIPQAREDQAATDYPELDSSLASASLEPAATETTPADETETAPDDANSPDDNYFWANTGDVISIDGNQGYGHIDLACFDISDATFHGNKIQIACDDGTSFLIEHCNVTHAIFADGVEIELTAEDTDSEQA